MHRLPATNINKQKAPLQQVVVFGASGDLAKRKIYPALHTLFSKQTISDDTQIIGYGRTPFPDGEFIKQVTSHIKTPLCQRFLGNCTYVTGGYDDFELLQQHLDECNNDIRNRIFYLSLPPSSYFSVVKKLPQLYSESGWNRVVMEKPFGRDMASFLQLRDHVAKFVSGDSLYLMDHYLGKPAVEHLWQTRGIFSDTVAKTKLPVGIEICFSEQIGVEGRSYFDESGIVRDIVQNHVLQMIAVLLDPKNKLGVLRELSRCKRDLTMLGQYVGYPFLPSTTPTYVETVCYWRDIPITIKAGKALEESSVDMYVTYECAADNIRINVQPHGAIIGNDHSKLLDFVSTEEAYEVMIRDVFMGSQERFMSMDEVQESWDIVHDIIDDDMPLFPYNRNQLSLSK